MIKQSKDQAGFSLVEVVLVLVMVGLVAGIGYWVSKQRSAKNSTSNQSTLSTAAKLDASKLGTVSGVEQVSKFDADDETKVEDELATQDQNNAQLDVQAVSSTGSGYDL